VVDDREPEGDSDLRRRAAWLLAMLVVVAVLVVIVMTQLIGTNDGDSKKGVGPGPLDTAISSPHPSTSADPAPSTPRTTPSTRTSTATNSSSTSNKPGSCPTSKTCILDSDVGNGVAAINAYRTAHGKSALDGSVSDAAQTCALHNGNGCSGGWAETELATPNGTEAVQKILKFAHLLDPGLKSVGVGWAYDPGAKLYYFAIVSSG
jgi:hypothetical protein